MDADLKDNILDILSQAYDSFKSMNSNSLVNLSDRTLHSASIEQDSNSIAIAVMVYSLASSVALQRVYADKHWASDVLAGAALGTAVGRWVAAKKEKSGSSSVLLLPVYSRNYTGASAVINF